MEPRRIASTAAVLGGLVWLASVVLVWMSDDRSTEGGAVGGLFFVGLAALAVALAAGGYTLVETAPVWLRAVVSVAVPLLVFMVWILAGQAIEALYTTEGWIREEADVALGGAVAIALGLWGFTRHAELPDTVELTRPVRGRRAAR